MGRAHAVGDAGSLADVPVSKADGDWIAHTSKQSAGISSLGREWTTAFSDLHCGHVQPTGCSTVTFRARPPGRRSSSPPTDFKNHCASWRETAGAILDLRPEKQFGTRAAC